MPNKQEKRIGIRCTQGRSCWSFFILFLLMKGFEPVNRYTVEQYFVFVTPLFVDSFAKFWVSVSPIVFFAKLYGMPFYSLFQLFNVCQRAIITRSIPKLEGSHFCATIAEFFVDFSVKK